jgi:hypothetical protein
MKTLRALLLLLVAAPSTTPHATISQSFNFFTVDAPCSECPGAPIVHVGAFHVINLILQGGRLTISETRYRPNQTCSYGHLLFGRHSI